MIILIDMDEVLADFQGGLEAAWQHKHPTTELFPGGERTSFYVGSGRDSDIALNVGRIIQTPGFFENLKPVDGAIQAMQGMHEQGHSLFILTSPGVSYPNAASEKYRWVERHFGKYMLERLVITPAKPIVKGDILIDDRPQIDHEEWADWEHILFDRPYNREVEGKRRLNWTDWQEVLSRPRNH